MRNIWHFNLQSHKATLQDQKTVMWSYAVSLIWVWEILNLWVESRRPPSVCISALCSSCRVDSDFNYNDVTWFQKENVCLSLSTIHGGSESKSQNNITTSMWLFNSLWRHLWLSIVSLSQTSFHTQQNAHLRSNDCSCGFILKADSDDCLTEP